MIINHKLHNDSVVLENLLNMKSSPATSVNILDMISLGISNVSEMGLPGQVPWDTQAKVFVGVSTEQGSTTIFDCR
jgi:hypothetical protein